MVILSKKVLPCILFDYMLISTLSKIFLYGSGPVSKINVELGC